MIPKSRRTYDPEYEKAKQALKSYIIDNKKLISSIRQLGQRAKEISKCYSKFSSIVTKWYPDTTPAVRQSLKSINSSAEAFNKITVDSFINTIVPNFEETLKEYKKQTNDLVRLQKNRKKAVNSLDRNKEKLRKAQCVREPDNVKIDQLQRKVDACETSYNSLNDQFISAINEFTESRKDILLHSFEKCVSGLIHYINDAVQIPIIKFPDDPNAPLIVDPKIVVNHDDIAQHINQNQPILPPATSNNYGQQMPIYIQNNYEQPLPNSQSVKPTTGYPNSTVQGPSLLPPSAGYRYNPPPQNLPQDPTRPIFPRSASSAYAYDVQPQTVETAKKSYDSSFFSSSETESSISGGTYDSDEEDHKNDN